MKLSRRRFFQAAAVTPLAAKKAAEEAALNLVGMAGTPSPSIFNSSFEPQPINQAPVITPAMRQLRLKTAFLDKDVRDHVKSLMYQANRQVYRIDHDIAVKRSFSLMAKVTFQRQRDVERQWESEIDDGNLWQKLQNFLGKIVGYQ